MNRYLVTAFHASYRVKGSMIIKCRQQVSFKDVRMLLKLLDYEWDDFEFGPISLTESRALGKKIKKYLLTDSRQDEKFIYEEVAHY